MGYLNLVGARNPYSDNIDLMSVEEIIRLINLEEKTVAGIVERAIPQIVEVTEKAMSAIQSGGRLILCGAGSASGRLVEAEVAQLEPSYGMDPSKIVALSFGLGGPLDLIEDLENKEEYGEEALKNVGLCNKDVVIGVSGTGQTLSIVGCLKYAKQVGALAVALCCNIGSKIEEIADISILTPVGPEIITESARHKGGTAHKMVLNMITSSIVIKLGYVYRNIKVGLPTNRPNLWEKGIGFVIDATKCTRERAELCLKRCNGNVKVAVLMILNDIDSVDNALSLLDRNGGRVRL
ncbi:MAG: N-acetylmuramic acid 6-phosphate etherase [Bacillota bacterium]|nr:N-acetylmuramic acid 6-phosphate etherase [Bacillota bacterium]